MKINFFKKAASLTLALIMLIPSVVIADDELINTDPVANTYIGRSGVTELIPQLQFTDLPTNASQRNAIVRGGAFEVIRPEAGTFRPSAPVTREEAIVFALRAAGLSEQAMTAGQNMAGDLPGLNLERIWTFGYLQIAQQRGLISADEFAAAQTAATAPPPVEGDEESGIIAPIAPIWLSTANATREEVAFYLFTAMQSVQADIFAEPSTTGISLQGFNDWRSVSANRANAVETLLRLNVMNGQTTTSFGPNSTVTRGEMAQIIANLDNMHFELLGLTRVLGTVTEISNEQNVQTGAGTLWRHVRVRRADGTVDVLSFTQPSTPSPQDVPLDAVVLRGNNVVGLTALQENDQIEYFIHEETGTVWYVNVTGQAATQTLRGRLEIIDVENGTMTFFDSNGNVFTFSMIDGMYGLDDNGDPFIRFINILRPVSSLPRGTYYDFTTVGNLITAIEFVGNPVLVHELRGIVIDNNYNLGSLTILDENRRERSFNYIPGTLQVQRREFFDPRSTVGGIHEMFPGFNPRETGMESIIPGDIVVLRVDENNPTQLTFVSAVENITSRYGRILQFTDRGGSFDMLMEFENGQSAWFVVPGLVFVFEQGRVVNPSQVQIGDWARVMVNQAILAPGVIIETVREIHLDTGGHHINRIVMGRVAGFHNQQNTIQIEHAQELTPAGWSNHSPMASYNINHPGIRFYHDGRAVTQAHVQRYLQRSNATVYMALENHFAGERAIMVSIRSGRDELLRPSSILGTNANGFNILEIPGTISTDAGTIVVRNGRLVEQGNISAPDWARVSLNGGNNAAVVNIEPAPATSGVQIIRGRIAQVMPNQSFVVEDWGIRMFEGLRWSYTPVARTFTIDHDTLFLDASGAVSSIDNFIGFGDESVIRRDFNIVVEGSRAVRVIDAPFTNPTPELAGSLGHQTVRGTIYAINGNQVSIRDMTVYNGLTGQWHIVSNINSTGTVTVNANAIIVDRNQVVGVNSLRVGQQIMALSNDPRTDTVLAPGLDTNAFIVLVES